MKNFDSILVANRGEIAVRIIRTARQLGYRTIAVYSEADTLAPHVSLADEAVLIGPAPAKESYLDIERILVAAEKTGAQAVHPGYGFLSENARFSRSCERAGMVFIGPAAEAIEVMGNKAAAKRRMLEAGVPCIPGYQDPDQSEAALLSAAREIGLPLMVKAAAGGGGRGMRLVTAFEQLPTALTSARSEAENAFGCGELILEKAVVEPRHVEIQVFGDTQGHVIHLGERDCSVQRRHQKVVEEAPCPVMTAELRNAMGQAAVSAARSIGYVGAGTVEFLLDADKQFFFLEMNTRLQVEHPVTEMITGQDLVALQIQVAQGFPLPLQQNDVQWRGHAIEARLYAEDPENDFLPASGVARVWCPPAGEGIRVDDGLVQGQEISPFYDPMVAKIAAWGPDRETARRRLAHALDETVLFGVDSNREFLIDILRNPAFIQGAATTGFIGEHCGNPGATESRATPAHLAIGACLLYREAQADSNEKAVKPVAQLSGFCGAAAIAVHSCFDSGDGPVNVYTREPEPCCYDVTVGGETHRVEWLAQRDCTARLIVDGVQLGVHFSLPAPGEVTVQLRGRVAGLIDQLALTEDGDQLTGSGSVVAPMHGNLTRIAVAVGDRVEPGQDLAVMEAMKMEHRLRAEISGEVAAVHAVAGEQISAGALLLEISVEKQ